MRKRFLERLGGDTAQPISYRDAILNMLGIMDDLRMNKQTLEISTDTRIEYEKMIQEAKNSGKMLIIMLKRVSLKAPWKNY